MYITFNIENSPKHYLALVKKVRWQWNYDFRWVIQCLTPIESTLLQPHATITINLYNQEELEKKPEKSEMENEDQTKFFTKTESRTEPEHLVEHQVEHRAEHLPIEHFSNATSNQEFKLCLIRIKLNHGTLDNTEPEMLLGSRWSRFIKASCPAYYFFPRAALIKRLQLLLSTSKICTRIHQHGKIITCPDYISNEKSALRDHILCWQQQTQTNFLLAYDAHGEEHLHIFHNPQDYIKQLNTRKTSYNNVEIKDSRQHIHYVPDCNYAKANITIATKLHCDITFNQNNKNIEASWRLYYSGKILDPSRPLCVLSAPGELTNKKSFIITKWLYVCQEKNIKKSYDCKNINNSFTDETSDAGVNRINIIDAANNNPLQFNNTIYSENNNLILHKSLIKKPQNIRNSCNDSIKLQWSTQSINPTPEPQTNIPQKDTTSHQATACYLQPAANWQQDFPNKKTVLCAYLNNEASQPLVLGICEPEARQLANEVNFAAEKQSGWQYKRNEQQLNWHQSATGNVSANVIKNTWIWQAAEYSRWIMQQWNQEHDISAIKNSNMQHNIQDKLTLNAYHFYTNCNTLNLQAKRCNLKNKKIQINSDDFYIKTKNTNITGINFEFYNDKTNIKTNKTILTAKNVITLESSHASITLSANGNITCRARQIAPSSPPNICGALIKSQTSMPPPQLSLSHKKSINANETAPWHWWVHQPGWILQWGQDELTWGEPVTIKIIEWGTYHNKTRTQKYKKPGAIDIILIDSLNDKNENENENKSENEKTIYSVALSTDILTQGFIIWKAAGALPQNKANSASRLIARLRWGESKSIQHTKPLPILIAWQAECFLSGKKPHFNTALHGDAYFKYDDDCNNDKNDKNGINNENNKSQNNAADDLIYFNWTTQKQKINLKTIATNNNTWLCYYNQKKPPLAAFHVESTLPKKQWQWPLSLAEKLKLYIIPTPIICDLRRPESSLDHPKQLEINYWRAQQEITFFVHGFNVGFGVWGKEISSVTKTKSAHQHHAEKTTVEHSKYNCEIWRDTKTLEECFPNIASEDITKFLKYSKEGEKLNGTGDINWFLNMEHQCFLSRCATLNSAQTTGPTNELYYKKYQRLCNVRWPGNPHSVLDYHSAELECEYLAPRLCKILMYYKKQNIPINIIAHSLGCGLIIKACEYYARNNRTSNLCENIFLWQAAVPKNCFQINSSNKLWSCPNALYAAKHWVISSSANDNILGPLAENKSLRELLKDKNKPFWNESFPAWCLHKLGWSSVYEISSSSGISIKDIFREKDQNLIYTIWRKKLNQTTWPDSLNEFIENKNSYEIPAARIEKTTIAQIKFEATSIKDSNHSAPPAWIALPEKLIVRRLQRIWVLTQILKKYIAKNRDPALGYAGPNMNSPEIITYERSGTIQHWKLDNIINSHSAIKNPDADLKKMWKKMISIIDKK